MIIIKYTILLVFISIFANGLPIDKNIISSLGAQNNLNDDNYVEYTSSIQDDKYANILNKFYAYRVFTWNYPRTEIPSTSTIIVESGRVFDTSGVSPTEIYTDAKL